MRRGGVACPFAPDDRLLGVRLQQMHAADAAIEKADLRVAGTEPNGSFLGWDKLVNRPGHELAPAEMRVGVGPVSIERDGGLIFWNSLVVPVLCAHHLALGETRGGAARRGRQGAL